ncbi:hypothetical protein C6P40_000791 [Pichia californica]|uniref:Pru domain-containing protein n=1 Tax=Pichia californica TaxID=460514 RepID=A0A9P6WPG9_9ASCO|nr:hypothetical protein C6P42_000462 [[Candida] californica]KAG0690894.1 hypothetical protein C6P40_000791 [[Candida] californica]
MTITLPLKFNAGKVEYNEKLDAYVPLPTPGEIIVDHSSEGEGCYSFTWKPRNNDSVIIDELLVFEGDVVWQKINSCKSGRVYMLAFLSSGAKSMYWMQDVNDDGAGEDDDDELLFKDSKKDLEIAAKLRSFLCEPLD